METQIINQENNLIKESSPKKSLPAAQTNNKKKIIIASVIIIIVAAAVGFGYWTSIKNRVYTDKAQVWAPQIALSPTTAGRLEEVFVKEGDQVASNTVVARVGAELIKTKSDGLVISTKEDIGGIISPGMAVVTIINPDELRIVAQVDENKGLKNISVGQKALFTVDAFGSKKYYGVVDEVSLTPHSGDIVFNISDKRQVNQFDVKIRYNIKQYPELKNGMSAKVWIYTE